MKISLQKNFLKIIALTALVFSISNSASANSATLLSSGNFPNDSGGYTVDNDVTLTQSLSNTQDANTINADVITMNSANDLTVGSGVTLTSGGAANVISYSANATSASDLIIQNGASLQASDLSAKGILIGGNFGDITNNGSISVNGTGVILSGSINSFYNQSLGNISGSRGIFLSGENLANGFKNDGAITGTDSAVVSDTSASGDIKFFYNNGNISASSGNTVWLIGNTISGADGTLNASISNDTGGTITSSSISSALYVDVGSVASGINNAGIIQNTGGGSALEAVRVGDLTNSGTISSTTGSAVYYDTGSEDVNIVNSGTISGGGNYGIFSNKSGNLHITNNGGTITGGVTAILSNGNSNDTLDLNGGTINGVIALGSGNDIVNVGNGVTINGILSLGSDSGDTVNFVGVGRSPSATVTGTILSSNMNIMDGAVNVGNSIQLYSTSVLSLSSGTALNFTNDSFNIIGTINNSGTINIAAGKTAILNATSTINNNGAINGGDASSALNFTNLTINNNATGSIALDLIGYPGSPDNALTINGAAGSSINGNINLLFGSSANDIVNFGGTENNFASGKTISSSIVNVNAGTLNMAGTFNLYSTSRLVVANGATLNINSSQNNTVTTLINVGNINIASSQNFGFVNNSSFFTIIFNSGSITGASGSSISSVSGTDLIINNTAASSITTDIFGDSGVNFLGFNAAPTSTFSGSIDLGGQNGDVIYFGNNPANVFNSSDVIASNIVNINSGTFNMNGGSQFNLYGTGSQLNIASGATLNVNDGSLDHTIDTINNSGTIAMALNQGLVTSGDINVYSGGTIRVNILDIFNYSGLAANTLHLNGGTLSVNVIPPVFPGGGLQVGDKLIGVILSNGTTGISDGMRLNNSGGFGFKAVYDVPGNPNIIDIEVVHASSLTQTITPGSNIGSTLDSIINTGSGDAALTNLVSNLNNLNGSAQTAALKTLSPDTSGSNTQAAQAVTDASLGTVESHLESGMVSNSSSAASFASKLGFSKVNGSDSDSSSGGIWASTFGGNVANGSRIGQKVFGANSNQVVSTVDSGWGQVFGSSVSQTKREGVSGYNAQIAGFAFGADLLKSKDMTAGLSFSYGRTNAKGVSDKTDIDSYQIAGYGTKDFDKYYIDGLAAIAFNRYNGSRTLFDGSVARRSSDGNQYSLKSTAGYKIGLPGFNLNLRNSSFKFTDTLLTPFVSIQASRLTQSTYTETGSTANLVVKNRDINLFKTGIGFKVASNFKSDKKIYTPRFFTGFYNDWAGDAVDTVANFTSAPSNSFSAKGAPVARRSLKFGVGLDMLTQNDFTLSLDYIYEDKQQFSAHTGSIKGKWRF